MRASINMPTKNKAKPMPIDNFELFLVINISYHNRDCLSLIVTYGKIMVG